MSARLHWFKFNRGDYMRRTAGWPPAARLAFLELSFAQWDDGSLPVDESDVRSLVPGLSNAEWRDAWPRLDRLFAIAGDCRIDPEIDALREATLRAKKSRSEMASRAARARWKDRVGVDPDGGKGDA